MVVISTDQQQLLERNLKGLRVCQGDLARRLESLPSERIVPLLNGNNGLCSAQVRCEDGAEVLLASRHDPLEEARRWIDCLERIDEDTHTVVVTGCGLGYHVAELLRRRRGGLVVVLEPAIEIVQAAMRCNDFLTDILLRRVVFVVAGERSELFAPLWPYNAELMLGTTLTQHPPSARVRPTGCSDIQRIFTEYLRYARSSIITMVGISAATCENILGNLPYYLGWPDISPLKDSCKGRLGVCVAAGPSLRKNMHLLAQVKGCSAIIAVQTVLKTLLSAGIRPDYITSLDYSPLSERFYEDLPNVDDITLVADPKVNSIVPRSFTGPVRMFYNDFAHRILKEMGDDHDHLQAGATVAHLNFYLARYMGCDPIVLIGQDLGFGENVYYAPGNPIHTTWSPELNRFNSIEMMEWLRIVRSRNIMRKVPGADGRQIYTNEQMFTYLQQFERDVAAAEVKVINATEGGAEIAGAEQMPFAEVIERYGRGERQPLPPVPQVRPDAAERAAEAVRCMKKRMSELDRMEEICNRVLRPLREMTDALGDPSRFNRLHAKMNKWRLKIDSIKNIYNLVSSVVQLAEIKRLQMDKAIDRKDLDEIAERRDQLARDIQYVSLLREGVQALRKMLNKATKRLQEAQ
ncbi:MAG: DUF115 domain-containing protein [Planctomycetes bacterium]|nr:DUF115 domain-containing protein [Planctomycetota bacterium]